MRNFQISIVFLKILYSPSKHGRTVNDTNNNNNNNNNNNKPALTILTFKLTCRFGPHLLASFQTSYQLNSRSGTALVSKLIASWWKAA